MDNIRTRLGCFLGELGVNPSEIKDLSPQKAQYLIYLGQLTGADACYRFKPSPQGPYCKELHKDLSTLRDRLKANPNALEGKKVNRKLREKIKATFPRVISIPREIELEEMGWMEIISTAHFLHKICGMGRGQVDNYIKDERSELYDSLPRAFERLEGVGLLPRVKDGEASLGGVHSLTELVSDEQIAAELQYARDNPL